jgi:hypothetical protein
MHSLVSRRPARWFVAIIAAALATLVLAAPATAGYGGQALQNGPTTSTSVLIAITCYDNYFDADCAGGAGTYWYTRSASTCTHAYPNNDYYANYVPVFNTVLVYGLLNCKIFVVYPNSTQGGGGAYKVDANFIGSWRYVNRTFHSISFSNR